MQLPTEVTPESLLVEVYPGISQGMKLVFIALIECLVDEGWDSGDIQDLLCLSIDPVSSFFTFLCLLLDESSATF